MRAWVTYMLGISLVVVAVFGAYQAYSMHAQTTCAGVMPASGTNNFRHAPLRA